MQIFKMIIGAYWLAVVWNFFVPFAAPLNAILPFSALAILAIHVLEIMIFASLIRKVSDSIPREVVLILLFGVTRIAELRRALPIPSDSETQS